MDGMNIFLLHDVSDVPELSLTEMLNSGSRAKREVFGVMFQSRVFVPPGAMFPAACGMPGEIPSAMVVSYASSANTGPSEAVPIFLIKLETVNVEGMYECVVLFAPRLSGAMIAH